MHFVTGGAFNGKASWVKEYYRLEERTDFQWISAYRGDGSPDAIDSIKGRLLILEGIEKWVKDVWIEHDITLYREGWKNRLRQWYIWENAQPDRRLVIIGTDITKGIVPMEAVDREWRDATGWAYQEAAAAAKRVDLIWYGIHQRIK